MLQYIGTLGLIVVAIYAIFNFNRYLRQEFRTKSHYKLMLVFLGFIIVFSVYFLLRSGQEISKEELVIYNIASGGVGLGIAVTNYTAFAIYGLLNKHLTKRKIICQIWLGIAAIIFIGKFGLCMAHLFEGIKRERAYTLCYYRLLCFTT
ncbi:hypothetical protein HK103_000231 [Boothiomyces macroporosus]|uniref:Uncharacterized protein n=1 Tax=Boothiomyces macroporosus TaxID=261099 RepID=A0AAD5UL92_9FUNG|nr:hypothetical protein HK103_000231 [Boothiomyces macroporosus]